MVLSVLLSLLIFFDLRSIKSQILGGLTPMAVDLERSRHFPSAVALENRRIGGRHTECACYFHVKTSAIELTPCRSHFQGIPMPDFSKNNRLRSLHWCCIALIGCAILLSGCGSSEEAHDLHDDEHAGHEHAEDEHADHEHLEHFVPTHKPNDFEEMVDQLALRFPQLALTSKLTSTTGTGDKRSTARQELADIIGWIPELAADSELKKADFESAVATANKLSKFFQESASSAKATSVDPAAFEPLIEELRPLVPKSQARSERM